MKSLLKYILIISILIMPSCITGGGVVSSTEQKIESKEEVLKDNAKDLLAAAKEMMSKMKEKNPELERIINLIEGSQIALGASLTDGKEFKDLTGKKFDEVVNSINSKNNELLNEIEKLKNHQKEYVSEILTENIKAETIRKYESSKSIKFYTLCGTILAVLAGLVYFFPRKIVGIFTSLFSK